MTQDNPSATYWGEQGGSDLAGGAAYLAAIKKIPRMAGKLGGVKRFGAAVVAEQAASAAGGYLGGKIGHKIDTTTGHKVVDTKQLSDAEQTERAGGETVGFLAGAAAGAKHGIVGGAIGGAAGALGGDYISGKLAHALRVYHPAVANRIHRSAMS
jgi:hypothetical protein